MRLNRTLALGASLLVLFGACTTGGGGTSSPTAATGPTSTTAASATPTPPQPTIKIGSVGFYEAKIVAEIYGQALEAQGYTVDRAGIGLGTRDVLLPALESGQIDLQPEYIGSGLAHYEPGKQTGDPKANQTELQSVLNGKGGGITVLDYSPGFDQNAFVVRKATADRFSLTKMSDTTAVQDQLKWGLATDCKTNPVCAAALKSAYGLAPKNVTYLAACDTKMAAALLATTIDVAELCSTQPDIAKNGWVLLQDDKATQPADNVAPLVRNDYLAKLGDKAGFEKILNDISAKLTTDGLLQMGASFNFDKKDIKDIAHQWLVDNGFIKAS
ncbi:MAG: ABC transporter substrate-binding protein [Candidatus Limnocylindrales bacterium]